MAEVVGMTVILLSIGMIILTGNWWWLLMIIVAGFIFVD